MVARPRLFEHRSLRASLAASSLALWTPAASPCTVQGVVHVSSLDVGAGQPVRVEQQARVTFVGSTAMVEGVEPLAFRRVVTAASVALYLRSPVVLGATVGAARGVRVEVEAVDGPGHVRAKLYASDELSVRGVRLACRWLVTQPREDSFDDAPVPFAPTNRRWMTDSTAVERSVCRAGPTGTQRCDVYRNRCMAISDASVCGYRSVRPTLVVRAAPRDGSPSVIVEATDDISFADEDGNPRWLRVRSRRHDRPDALVVRGWVRRRDVRWSQEVPPSARRPLVATIGTVGVARPLGTRSGFVTLDANVELFAQDQLNSWARITRSYCAAAEQPPGSSLLAVALPGSSSVGVDRQGWVYASQARWVPSCDVPRAR
jgi:hypothetical protein